MKNICEKLLLMLKGSYSTPQGFCILINAYKFCKCPKSFLIALKMLNVFFKKRISFFLTMKSLLYFFKLVLEVFSLSVWVKHKKVKLSQDQMFLVKCRIPNGFEIKFFFSQLKAYFCPIHCTHEFFPNSLKSRDIGPLP